MRHARFLVPVAVTAALLAGCGSTPTGSSSCPSPAKSVTLSASEMIQKAGDALAKAGSYRMKGDVVSGGDKLSIDVKVQGTDALAIISMGSEGSITVLNVGGASYFQADEVFWKTTGGIDAKTYNTVFKDKWVKTKADDANMQKFSEFTDAKSFLDPAGSQSMTVGEKTTINGTSAWTLKDASSTEGALYVAAEGEPYPLRVEHGADGKIDFSEFGAKFDDIKAPPADKVISL